MGYRYDLKNKKFNNLKVISFAYNKNGRTFWKCKCDCGNYCIKDAYKIMTGHTKSCGCISLQNKKELYKYSIKHKMTNTPLYRTWQNMKRRCDNKKMEDYKYYGKRGIKVCEKWKNDFMSFYNWAIENSYKEDLTIDRIDVNGNYEPNNCRWVDRKVQANNTRRNHYIEYNGEKHTLAEWEKITNIKSPTLRYRIKNNYPLEKIFSNQNFGLNTRFKKNELED